MEGRFKSQETSEGTSDSLATTDSALFYTAELYCVMLLGITWGRTRWLELQLVNTANTSALRQSTIYGMCY